MNIAGKIRKSFGWEDLHIYDNSEKSFFSGKNLKCI